MTDVEFLEAQYAKYCDKSGRKAVALKQRIESFKAFAELINWVESKGTMTVTINKNLGKENSNV